MTARGVEPPLFRQLLGRFATGVTVITARTTKGDLIGMTANSLASVSLDPPLVLVAVEKQHEMHTAMENATHWVFNILSSEQEGLSRRFAGAEPKEAHGGADASVETVRREGPKVGRNDPCPCGSGRKYKKCHGA